MGRNRILSELLRLAPSIVQGGLSSSTRTCGKPQCPCHSDPARRHGPNLYFTWREAGKSQGLYVPPEHASEALAAQAAWFRFQELSRQLAALNRDQMRRRWLRSKSAGSRAAKKAS